MVDYLINGEVGPVFRIVNIAASAGGAVDVDYKDDTLFYAERALRTTALAPGSSTFVGE